MLRPTRLKIKNIISFKEAEFAFYQGQCVIIVGDNKDNPSQRGNGSGKSALLEAIALAFTGSSVRDVKTRELINNDAEDGEIELTLEDDSNVVRIRRKIFAQQNKSAEYQMWVNDKDQHNHYADFNSFNAWVFKILGISKEDFFSFYLLTRNTYTAFLRVGDTAKKEIINRFSGADTIDEVFPLIEADCKIVTQQLTDLNTKLTSNTAQQQVYAEQIQEEKEMYSDEKKQERVAKKKEEYDQLNVKRSQLQQTIKQLKSEVKESQKQVDKFKYKKEYDTLQLALNNDIVKNKAALQTKREELGKVREKFTGKLKKVTEEETEMREELDSSKKSLRDLETLESSIQKQLLGLIECPKCKHKFSLADKGFDEKKSKKVLEETISEINDYKELIEVLVERLDNDIVEQKDVINKEIEKAQEKVRAKVDELVKSTTDLQQQVEALNEEKEEEDKGLRVIKRNIELKTESLTHNEKLVKNNQIAIDVCIEEIQKIESEESDGEKEKQLNEKLEKLIKAETELKKQIELKEREKSEVDVWELHFKGFKSHLANKSIRNIQDYTNLFLESMGTDLSIEVDGYKTLANKKIKEQITTTVLRNGFPEGSYGKFSGGERGRIDISVILALQELINLNSPTGGLDLLVIDEVLDQVDALGLEHIVLALQGIGKTIMIVSQNEINALNDYTITVRKENKTSTII